MQTALFVPRIAALGHEMIIFSPHNISGSPLGWEGFRVIPAAKDSYGNDIIVASYRHHEADLLITLCDVFTLRPSAAALAEVNVAHWTPVDCDPAGEGDMLVLREGHGIPVAMSRFGERVLGAEEGLEPLYVPHGVDTDAFAPGPRDEIRESLGFPPEMFVIGVCAMNRDPVRKGFAEQMMAFAAFHERHRDSRLMLHTAPVSEALHLEGLARRLGIQDVVMFPDQYSYATGAISREMVASWYTALDVLSACSYGEGFCLPALEAQACGTPVVATDCSALAELCGAGWLVAGERHWVNGHGSWWMRPPVAGITEAYEAAWEARQHGEMPGLREQARKFALGYDADVVASEFWEPCLKQLEAQAKEA